MSEFEAGQAAYDSIGAGYALQRVPDPRIAAQIEAALGDARTVCNVGAGTGSYEPVGREVGAVEPARWTSAIGSSFPKVRDRRRRTS